MKRGVAIILALMVFALACDQGTSNQTATPPGTILSSLVASASGTPPPGDEIVYVGPEGGLWLMNADGTFAHRIYDGASGYAYAPEWSPAGDKIAFTEMGYSDATPSASLSVSYGDITSVVIVDVQGHVLSKTPRAFIPHWSPDGTKLTFLADLNVENESWVGVPSILDTTTGAVQRIASRIGSAESPRWSPNGKLVAYSDNATGLFVFDPEGNSSARLLDTGGTVYLGTLDWASNENLVAFDEYFSEARYLVINLGQGKTGDISNQAAFQCGRSWSPRDAQPVAIRDSPLIAWPTQCVDVSGVWLGDTTGETDSRFLPIPGFCCARIEVSSSATHLLVSGSSSPLTITKELPAFFTRTGSIWIVDIDSGAQSEISTSGRDAAWRPTP